MTSEIKPKKKIKKPTVIVLEKTSPFIFLVPCIAFILLFYYSITQSSGSLFFIYMIGGILLFIPSILQFLGKQYVLTEKKFYFYEKNEKKFSGNLLEDFKLIDFQQTFIGKILNYGTLILVKQDDSYYSYSYLNNVVNSYQKTILQYEKLVLEVNPDFEAPFTQKNNNIGIDTINNVDKINDNSDLLSIEKNKEEK